MTASPDRPDPGPAAPGGDAVDRVPAPRAHLLAGAASVLVSGLLGVTWLWISISVLVTGISALPVAGAGALLLVPWVVSMRWAAAFERRRARAVHGIDVVVPARRVSIRPGALGWLHTVWLDATSWTFWRSALHHHAVMTVGALVCSCFWAALGAAVVLPFALLDPSSAPARLGAIPVLAIAAGLALVAAGVLAIGVLVERGLARVMLPDADDGLRAEVTELSLRRQGAVDAAEAERLRIERDLHDGIQPRLVALSMTLGLARSRIATDPERAERLVAEAHEESKGIMTELRQLARGIHPAVLTDRGLDAALSALAARSVVPVDLQVSLPVRPSREAETVAYFVVSEALTNVAKHARASRAHVLVRGDERTLHLEIDDDGVGGASVHRDGASTGLAGLTDRVRASGGRLEISSTAGSGTRLIADIPASAPGTGSIPSARPSRKDDLR